MKHRALLWILLPLALGTAGCGCSSAGSDTVAPFGNATAPLADRAVDFTLVDQNPASATAGQWLSVRQQLGTISAWYFGDATSARSRMQLQRLDALGRELPRTATGREIRILDVNAPGAGAALPQAVAGLLLTALQDEPAVNARAAWQAGPDDVVILDAGNRVLQVFGLQTRDLTNPADYAALRQILQSAP
jgi:hypothetical protein